MKAYIISLYFLAFNLFGYTQLLTFDFAGLAGNEVSANSNFNDPNISASSITRGTGLTSANNADRFNATNWSIISIADAVSQNKYMEFTITPNSTCDFSISSISIQLQRSGTGPSRIALRSSVDGYTSNLDQEYVIVDNTVTQNFTFTFTQSNITSATTYRIYMFAEASGGTGGPGDGAGNDIIVNGTTNCGAPANTITTTTVNGSPFSVNCSASASGSVDFTSTGTFNAGNIYTAELSDVSGSFTSPTVIGTLTSTANSGTINITIPAGTASGSAYRIRVISSNPAITGSDNGTDLSITLSPCTIATGAVSGAPFTVDCSLATDDSGTVDFTSTGTFAAGNIYTAQLSNSSGSFASPTIVGTLSSTANSGTINITISSSTSSGSGYRIRVVSSDPVLTGTDNGSDLTITQSGPCLPTLPSAGLLINEFSNGASGEKEYYEFVVAGRCGELVDIRGFIIDDNNGTFSDVFPSTSGIAPGHLKLSNDAQWQSIPVGSLIVVYNAADPNTSLPADDINDSNNDSLYVIPHNNTTLFNITTELPSNTIPDSTYSPIGSYASVAWGALSLRNAGDAVQVRSPNGDYFHGVSYGGSEMTGGPDNMKIQNSGMGGECGWFSDGDIYNIANWNTGTVSGNETPGSPNNAANLAWLRLMRDPNAATCPVIVLPSIAINLEGKYENGQSIIEWQTSSEQNNSHFTISHSTSGKQFSPIGTIAGAGNSSELIQYRFIHAFPHPGINYYKLHSTDYDGTTYYKGIVAINAEFNFMFYNAITSTIELQYESDIEIYSPDGKLIETAIDTKSVPFYKSGLFFILDKRSGIMERLFIP